MDVKARSACSRLLPASPQSLHNGRASSLVERRMFLMNNNYRWIAVLAALLLAAMVGFAAYQAGVERGIEQSGKIVAPPSGASPYPYPYPYPYYGWHRPWGFGGFFFFPLFFLFWFLIG